MPKDPESPPPYPMTYGPQGHNGLVWGWVFWWCRNHKAWIQAAPGVKAKKRRTRDWHSVTEEVVTECYLLP